MSAKRTPLYHHHVNHQAKIIDFHGWEMPVQYQSIVQEHHAVRTNAGVFDVSHMGEFVVEGTDARSFVQYLVTNDVERLETGRAMYTPMTNETGGTIDDLLVYQLSNTKYMLVVNAGNIAVDYAWIEGHAKAFDVSLRDISETTALVAIQGPQALSMLRALTDTDVSVIKPFTFVTATVANVQTLVSRTGYTGEDGFEIYVSSADAGQVFEELVHRGAVPCGLGARDTLRLEARLPLYGNELNLETSPLEAGLSPFVKLDKGDFIGRAALAAQKEAGLERKLVGIEMEGKGIPRMGYTVWDGDQQIGVVTSGTMSPTLQKPVALALVNMAFTDVGASFEIDIRGKRHAAHVIKTPFYKRNS